MENLLVYLLIIVGCIITWICIGTALKKVNLKKLLKVNPYCRALDLAINEFSKVAVPVYSDVQKVLSTYKEKIKEEPKKVYNIRSSKPFPYLTCQKSHV